MALLCALAGCGTTRSSNTQRTATEQLLISDAIDRAVQAIDFRPLAGRSVFFDDRHLYEAVDDAYLISSLRQHLLASGCILKDNRDEATFIVEPRAGAVGTDNQDWLFGMPATNVPQLTLLAALPPAIPEIPIAKRQKQRGVAKIAVFAYHRETGQPAWQSGIAARESTSNDIWVLGAGPFQRGTIYEGSQLAKKKNSKRKRKNDKDVLEQDPSVVRLTHQAVFDRLNDPDLDGGGDIQQASAEQAVEVPASQEQLPTSETVAEGSGAPVLPPPATTANPALGATTTQ